MNKLDYKKLIFVGILIFSVVSVVYLIKKNGSHVSGDIVKIGFVTDVEYSGGTRVNEKLGEKGLEYLENVINHFNQEAHPNVVVGGGDYIVGSRTSTELAKDELKEVLSIFDKSKGEIFYSVGARDAQNIDLEYVLKKLHLENSYYSRDYKGYRFVMLDTISGEVSDEQLNWLEKEIDTEKPVIIFSHQGVIESPDGVVWKKNLKNGKDVRNLLKEQKNILAVFSGNTGESYVGKESSIPYIFVAGLTERRQRGSFADISIERNDNEFIVNLKTYFNNDYSEYEIKRYLYGKKETKIDQKRENKNQDVPDQLWIDLEGNDNPKGLISNDKGTEVGIDSNENGVIVAAFEDKEIDKKISVKKFQDEKWSRVGEKENSFASLGKGSNPFVKMKGDDIFVAFTEIDHNERPRVVSWSGNSWVGLSDAYHPNGFISNYPSLEPSLAFDKSKKNLYVAFNEKSDEIDYRIKLLKWDGERWMALSDKSSGYMTNTYSSEVDLEASQIDESVLYLAYEDTFHENKIRVMKWDGKKFSLLSDEEYPEGFVGNMEGYSPSIDVDDNDNVYLTYSSPKPGKTFAFKWDGISWQTLGEGGLVSTNDTIESSIIVDESAKNILIAYSEFRENIVNKRILNDKERFFNEGVWKIRVRKFEDGQWVDFGKRNSGYASDGNGKGDPSLTIFNNKLFMIFTDEEHDHKARVRFCDLKNVE
ncbi:MAG: metallophosphoesterase [Candidatus Moranbacteria bacterium]|nr:metallophosphoesterase [Candidatus Moranbacteria bacterium]